MPQQNPNSFPSDAGDESVSMPPALPSLSRVGARKLSQSDQRSFESERVEKCRRPKWLCGSSVSASIEAPLLARQRCFHSRPSNERWPHLQLSNSDPARGRINCLRTPQADSASNLPRLTGFSRLLKKGFLLPKSSRNTSHSNVESTTCSCSKVPL